MKLSRLSDKLDKMFLKHGDIPVFVEHFDYSGEAVSVIVLYKDKNSGELYSEHELTQESIDEMVKLICITGCKEEE